MSLVDGAHAATADQRGGRAPPVVTLPAMYPTHPSVRALVVCCIIIEFLCFRAADFHLRVSWNVPKLHFRGPPHPGEGRCAARYRMRCTDVCSGLRQRTPRSFWAQHPHPHHHRPRARGCKRRSSRRRENGGGSGGINPGRSNPIDRISCKQSMPANTRRRQRQAPAICRS